jgi:hypothetical protein
MTRLLRRNLIIGLATFFSLLIASALVIANTDTQWKAEHNVRKFVIAEAKPEYQQYIKEYHFRANRLGTQSWLVVYGSPMVRPSIPSYCLVDRDGEITHMSPKSLSKVMRSEFHPNAHDSDHDKFINDFIHLLHHERTEIIDEARIDALKSDSHNPIYEDIAAKIRPPERTPDGTYIFFAYQRIGGYVRRYEFNYDSTGAFRECIVSEVASRVGPYLMYQ